jgi:hypothetical protein
MHRDLGPDGNPWRPRKTEEHHHARGPSHASWCAGYRLLRRGRHQRSARWASTLTRARRTSGGWRRNTIPSTRTTPVLASELDLLQRECPGPSADPAPCPRGCSRWSCAAAPRTAKTIRPPGVVVSMDSVRLFSPTPMVCKRSDKASRSRRFLESREREYTPRHLPAGGVRAWRRGLSARPLHL